MMRSTNGPHYAGTLLLAGACAVAACALPAVAGDAAAASVPLHLNVKFNQQNALTSCPKTVPAVDSCLAVTLSASHSELGPLEVSRVAVFNGNLYNPSTPACIPIETSGTVTLQQGTLSFRGAGSVCFVDATAFYDLIVTGGSGRFAGAIGGGRITIPPPTTDSTGPELWSMDLYLKRS